MTRGIVVGARINTTGGVSMVGSVEIRDILQWILYWDEIAYAGVGIGDGSMSGNQPQDVSFLESAGIFRTEIVKFQSRDISSLAPLEPGFNLGGLSLNQLAAASVVARIRLSKQLSDNTGNIWTIGQSGGEDLLLPSSGGSADLIDVQLANCLPVPALGTPFDDILEFKNRYQDELGDFRRCLDRMRENILRSSDERRATDAAIHEIARSLSDIRRALQGAKISTVSETLGLYTNEPSLAFWTMLGGSAAAAKGLPFEFGATSAAAATTLVKFIKRSIVGGRNLPEELSDFAYVYEATKELDTQ